MEGTYGKLLGVGGRNGAALLPSRWVRGAKARVAGQSPDLYLEGRSVGGLAEAGVADVGERGEHTIEEGVLLALGGLGGGLQVRKRRGNKEHG